MRTAKQLIVPEPFQIAYEEIKLPPPAPGQVLARTVLSGISHGTELAAPQIPDEYSLLEPVACAVTGLDHCRLRVGDRVALIGCGFMGAIILQGLLRSFAEKIIVIEKEPVRVKLAQRLGATDIASPVAADWPERLRQILSMQIDVVLDCTGAQAGLDLATQICRRGGRINLFGWNKEPRAVDTSHWHVQGLTIINSSPAAALRDPFPVAVRLLESRLIDLKPLITHIVPLREYPHLLEQAARGGNGYVRGVVKLTD
jgi:L-iditol 2-dehydrogenase